MKNIAKCNKGETSAYRIPQIAVVVAVIIVVSSLAGLAFLEKPSAGPASSLQETVETTQPPVDSASTLQVTIEPTQPRSSDNLEVHFAVPSSYSANHELTYTYNWCRNGNVQPDLTTQTVVSKNIHKNEKWKCDVTVSNGTKNTLSGSSDEVTILNSPPTSPQIAIEPKTPIAGDDLKCKIITPSSDPDGDALQYLYVWHKSGELQSQLNTNTVSSAVTSVGDTWKCTVTPTDGTEAGTPDSDMVTIGEALTSANPSLGPGADFTFVQLSDTHITDDASASVMTQLAQDIAKMPSNPTFVVNTGDIADAAGNGAYTSYLNSVKGFSCPVYNVIGNHDSEDGTKATYRSNLGATNYCFDVAPCHFIVLDSTKPDTMFPFDGGFDQATISWLSAHLATVSKSTPIIIFTHTSYWSPFQYYPGENLLCDVENPDDVARLLQDYNVVAVFMGHAHTNIEYTSPQTGTRFYVTGSMRSGTTNIDYTGPGYRVVECTSSSIETYWVPLGQIDDYYVKPKTNVVTVAQDGSGDYNGTTQTPIQQAINHLHSAHGGGTVLIKGGTYTLTGTDSGQYYRSISMYDNIWLKGSGNPVLRFCDKSGNKRGITCSDYVHNVRIEDLTIDCNGTNCVAGADHTWYNAIEMDGGWTKDHAPADADLVKDVVIQRVTVRDCPSRGIISYGGRRWSVRNCTSNDVYNPISPDHWTDFWQIEGNTMTNSGVGIELNDTSNSMIFNNTIDGITNNTQDCAIRLWPDLSASDSEGMTRNSIVGNHIRNVKADYAVDVERVNGYLEVSDNVLENVAKIGLLLPDWGPNWVIAHNTFNNVATPESYEENVPLRTPTGLDLQVSSTSVTVKAIDGGNSGSSLQYTFEAKEYTGAPEPTALAPVTTSSGTYTYSGLVPGHIYAFRCRVTAGISSAWTEWYFVQL